jgi:hypothetical protein
MSMWVLILFVFSVSQPSMTPVQPVGVTSVPGYASREDCERAGKLMQSDGTPPKSQIFYYCLSGSNK